MNPYNYIIAQNLLESQPLFDTQQHQRSIYDIHLGDLTEQQIPQISQRQREPEEQQFMNARTTVRPEPPANYQYIPQHEYVPEHQRIDRQLINRYRQQERHGYRREPLLTEFLHYHRRPYHHHERRQRPQQRQQGLDNNEIRSLTEIQYKSQNEWDEESRKCPICLGNYEECERVRFLPCLHRFHSKCIDKWLPTNSNCPLCKKNIRSLVMQYI
ncbi:hypothetical protein pb186bvf_003276 [Paramecium bursaria]